MALGLVLLFSTTANALDPDSDTYENNAAGIRLQVPESWHLSRHTGYPTMLALLRSNKTHARISLSAISLSPHAHSAQPIPSSPDKVPEKVQRLLEPVVRKNVHAMRVAKMKNIRAKRDVVVGRELWVVTATTVRQSGPGWQTRQYYLVGPSRHDRAPKQEPDPSRQNQRKRVAKQTIFVLTLASPPSEFKHLVGDLDYVLETLEFPSSNAD